MIIWQLCQLILFHKYTLLDVCPLIISTAVLLAEEHSEFHQVPSHSPTFSFWAFKTVYTEAFKPVSDICGATCIMRQSYWCAPIYLWKSVILGIRSWLWPNTLLLYCIYFLLFALKVFFYWTDQEKTWFDRIRFIDHWSVITHIVDQIWESFCEVTNNFWAFDFKYNVHFGNYLFHECHASTSFFMQYSCVFFQTDI